MHGQSMLKSLILVGVDEQNVQLEMLVEQFKHLGWHSLKKLLIFLIIKNIIF